MRGAVARSGSCAATGPTTASPTTIASIHFRMRPRYASPMRIATRPPRGAVGDGVRVATDPDRLASVLEDAAHVPGGHAAGLAMPDNEAEVAAVLRAARHVLPIGAQSSVTGGATPMGEVVLSSARLDRIVALTHGRARVEAGVPLAALQDALAARGQYYPPAPTYTGASLGGTVATNAA